MTRKFTLGDLRNARSSGNKVPMLTCYDYWSAVLMHEAGIPMLLAGDSAASVILGHPTTLPVSLDFMIEITSAVRRGAPSALLVGDMPFGSYQASDEQGVTNVFEMVKRSGCDIIKLEVSPGHTELVRKVTDAGVPVMVHLGLKPQAVGLLGGYKTQGRTAKDAADILALALLMERSGAAVILLEAVPGDVAKVIVERVSVPVIGCGAGSACHGSVVVTHDALGLTSHRAKFVPHLANLADAWKSAVTDYKTSVENGTYPSSQQIYEMPADELEKFKKMI